MTKEDNKAVRIQIKLLTSALLICMHVSYARYALRAEIMGDILLGIPHQKHLPAWPIDSCPVYLANAEWLGASMGSGIYIKICNLVIATMHIMNSSSK